MAVDSTLRTKLFHSLVMFFSQQIRKKTSKCMANPFKEDRDFSVGPTV